MTDSDPQWAFALEGLGHRYPDGTVALSGLTAKVPVGQTTAVLGPNGSGKSTLLSLLGLLWDGKGPEGKLHFHDGEQPFDLLKLPPDDKALLRSTRFGFVLQSSYLLPHFSCLENVAMPLALHGWTADARLRWAEALLSVEGVDPRGDLRKQQQRVPREASVGQRQQYNVLRAVIADPMVVFADEPSSNLDPSNTCATFALLARWQNGTLFEGLRKQFPRHTSPTNRRTLVLVCHDVQTARQKADHFLLLTQQHVLKADFSRRQWNANARDVETVLGLPDGAAGRDSCVAS